jgi:hypothetical protein
LNWPTKFGACKGCEFKATPEQEQDGLLSVQTLLHKTTSMDGVRIQTQCHANLEL